VASDHFVSPRREISPNAAYPIDSSQCSPLVSLLGIFFLRRSRTFPRGRQSLPLSYPDSELDCKQVLLHPPRVDRAFFLELVVKNFFPDEATGPPPWTRRILREHRLFGVFFGFFFFGGVFFFFFWGGGLGVVVSSCWFLFGGFFWGGVFPFFLGGFVFFVYFLPPFVLVVFF